jgi:hypothetical protein
MAYFLSAGISLLPCNDVHFLLSLERTDVGKGVDLKM